MGNSKRCYICNTESTCCKMKKIGNVSVCKECEHSSVSAQIGILRVEASVEKNFCYSCGTYVLDFPVSSFGSLFRRLCDRCNMGYCMETMSAVVMVAEKMAKEKLSRES